MTSAPEHAVPLQPVSDLRGVPVADAGGRPIGRLYGALAEVDSGLIRYLDLDLDMSERQRHVLVPIGHARIHDDTGKPRARLRAAVLDDLERIPAFSPGEQPIDDAFERDVIEAYSRCFYGDRYYAHPAFDHSGLYAGEHPIVRARDHGAAAPPPPRPGLQLLSRSDYRVARGEPDINGWPLMTDAAQPSGTVSDLVIDPAECAVRYAVVDIADGGGAVLLPVGFLQIDERRRVVWLPAIRHDDLATLPRFEGAEIERNLEDAATTALRTRALDRRRYALPDFRERATDRRRT